MILISQYYDLFQVFTMSNILLFLMKQAVSATDAVKIRIKSDKTAPFDVIFWIMG